VSQGGLADIDPEAWTIVGDKLYLNLNKKVQKKWSDNMGGYIRDADKNWPGVLQK